MYDYQPYPRTIRLPLEGCQVLLVEDNDDSREVATILLEAQGATVNAVACVKEALTSLDGSIPDVLVSDIGMPDRDGYDLIRGPRIKRRILYVKAPNGTHRPKLDCWRTRTAPASTHR